MREVPACYPPVETDRTLAELAPDVDAWERWWHETLEAHFGDEGMEGGRPLDALRGASRAWDEVCGRLADEPLVWVSRVKADTTADLGAVRDLWEVARQHPLPRSVDPQETQLRLVLLPVRGFQARHGEALLAGVGGRTDLSAHASWLAGELSAHVESLAR